MATITDNGFEGSFPPSGYTEVDASAHLDVSTNQANTGTKSMRVNSASSGAVAYMYDTVAGRLFVRRFYLRVAQKVSATSDITTHANANGNVYLRLLTTGVIRLTMGSTNYAGPTLTDNQWYRIDIRVAVGTANGGSAGTTYVDWQVDGAAQTSRTRAQTDADITELTLGIDTTATCDVYFDDYKVTDTAGDYPLGFTRSAAAEASAGTGAASNATKSLGPTSQASTGTGAANNAGKTLAAPIQASTGTGAAANAGKTLAASISAGTGTGAATDATVDIVESPVVDAPAEHIAATGAAYNATASELQTADAELASGTGEAAHAIGGSINVSAGIAAGTSSAYDAIADADSGAIAEHIAATGAAANAAVTISPSSEAALGTETLVDAATDTFTRSVSSDLGTADSGQAWVVGGTATDYNVDGSAATFQHTAVQTRRAWLPAVVVHDLDQTFRWKGPATVAGEHWVYITLRQDAILGDYLFPKLVVGADNSMTLSLNRRAVAVETELAATVLGITHEADTYYTIRTRLMGQGFMAKCWKSSDSEPTNWQLAVSETQLTAPGGIGMRTYNPSGSVPLTYSWDLLDSNEITGAAAYDATVYVVPEVNAIASAAMGTGAGADANGALALNCEPSTGTGAAGAIASAIEASVEVAAATGTTTDVGPSLGAMAEQAAATAAAWGVGGQVALGPDVAEAFGNALDAPSTIGGAAQAAAATGTAYDGEAFIFSGEMFVPIGMVIQARPAGGAESSIPSGQADAAIPKGIAR